MAKETSPIHLDEDAELEDLRSAPRVRARRKPTGARSAKRGQTAAAAPGAGTARHLSRPAESGTGSSDTRFRFQLAALLRMSDNLVSRAVGAYDKVFTLDQVDQAEICKKMGLDLAYRGRLDEALDALRKALALRPHDGHISLELGVVQLRRGAPQAALEHFQVAKDTGLVSYRLHRQLAEALLRLERDEEALAELDEAVHLKPSLPENHYRRGVVLDRLGRFGDALAAFSKAIELAPDDVVYHQTLGFTLESMGRRGEAIKCFKRALELERAVAAAKAEADAEAEA